MVWGIAAPASGSRRRDVLTQADNRTRRILVVAPLLLHVACGTETPRDELADLPAAPLTEELRIDGHVHDLVPIHWVGVAADGTIAITQQQDASIRFFDVDGAPAGSVGRRGAGPGEFEAPIGGGWLADTLWIHDARLNRVTLVGPELSVARTLPPLTGARPRDEDAHRLPAFHFITPVALYRGDVVLARAMGAAGDPLAEALGGRALVRITADGVVERLVLETPPDDGSIRITLPDLIGQVAIPFSARPYSTISEDGSRIVTASTTLDGSGGSIEVSAYDAVTGQARFHRAFTFTGEPVPAAAVDSAIQANAERASHPEIRRVIESDVRRRVPAVYPPVHALFVGKDHRIWLGLRPEDGRTPWLVLSPDGKPVARYETPAGVTLHVADSDHAWGLLRDELDVQSVVRFRLRS